MSATEPTSLNTGKLSPFDALEVDMFSHLGGRAQKDGSFKTGTHHKVSLSFPATAFRKRARLVNMTPRTALNLLTWLEQNREMLEQLAQEEVAQ